MENLDLFGMAALITAPSLEAFARATDPEAAKAAAKSVRVANLEAAVVKALSIRPMTSMEIAAFLCVSWNSISPRMRPLVAKGKVENSGVTRTIPGHRAQIVWRLP